MDFTTSFIANAIAIIACQPLDVLKTNIQTSSINFKQASSRMLRDRQCFRGLAPNLCAYPLFWGIYFQSKKNIDKHVTNPIIASYAAANCASAITNPLYVLKTQLQTSKNRPTLSVKYLYAGFAATTVNNMKLGFQFPLYEKLLRETNMVVFSAIVSKSIANNLLYPFELIRVRQRKELDAVSMLNISKNIYNARGLSGLYKGAGIYNVVSTGQFTIMMMCLESYRRFASPK